MAREHTYICRECEEPVDAEGACPAHPSAIIDTILGGEERKGKVESGIFGTGSFGLTHGRPGGVQRVWFCGRGYLARNGVAQDICAHSTRRAARECTEPVAPKGQLTE